jgi:calcineurin-like phosphoesterase family protein
MKLSEQWFVIADTHFGHDNLALMLYRPTNYNEVIIETWNSVVNKRDVVLFLGDISFVNKQKTIEYCKQLNGRKYLIRGNHDGASDRWYKDCGFEVTEPIYRRFKDKYDNYMTVIFTHEPVLDLPDGWYNIHGHLHGNGHRGEKPTDRHFDTSVDAMNYKPRRIYSILDELNPSRKGAK